MWRWLHTDLECTCFMYRVSTLITAELVNKIQITMLKLWILNFLSPYHAQCKFAFETESVFNVLVIWIENLQRKEAVIHVRSVDLLSQLKHLIFDEICVHLYYAHLGKSFLCDFALLKPRTEEEMLGIVLFAIKSNKANIRWQHCLRKTSKDERQSRVQKWISSQFAKFIKITRQFKHNNKYNGKTSNSHQQSCT